MRTFFLLILGSIVFTAAGQRNHEQAIERLLQQQASAWNQGDLTGFMEGYWKSDSLRFIGRSGITYGWQQTLTNYQRGHPDKTSMGTLRFTVLHLNKISGRYRQVIGKWELTRTIGNVNGYFTLLLKKQRGQWLIISDHSS